MQRTNPVIEHDHHHALATAYAAIPAPLAQPPAFLALPNWTVDETADYLRCESQTIRKALSLSGTFWGLKPRRFGRRWLFNAGEVRAKVEGGENV